MRFRKLEKEFFDYVVKQNPILATFLGVHKYDSELPDLSKKTIEKEIKKLKEFLRKFESVETKNFDEEISRLAAVYELRLELFWLEKIRMWERDPDVSFLGDALFPLIFRDFAPFNKRMRSALKRIEKFSKVLEQMKKTVDKPVKIWVDIALENIPMLENFLDTILEICKANKFRNLRKAEEIVSKAKKSLASYKEHLKKIKTKASEKYWLSDEEFDELIQLMLINLSKDEMLSLANYYLRRYQKEMKKVLKEMNVKTVKEAEKILENNKPKTFREALKYHKQVVKELKEFLRRNKLFTLPKGEKLVIMETPSYLTKLIPYAAYFPPAPFEKNKVGIYIVTPRQKLGKHLTYASIKNTVVHEAYPGHHLQHACASLQKSYVRHLLSPPEFVEGWAHYCEEYMLEKGFLNKPEEKFVFLKDAIWRACRVIVDIKLSTGRMSFKQAVNFLIRNAYLDREGALAEVKRYTKSPGYQLCYLIGKHMIKELRREFETVNNFNERKFNDLLMYEGNLPLYLFWFVMDRKFK